METARRPRLSTIALLGVVALALLAVAVFGGLEPRKLHAPFTHLHQWIVMPLFELGSTPISVAFLAKISLFLLLLGVGANVVQHLLQRRLLVHTPLALAQQFAFARIMSYVVFGLGVVIGLQSFGLNLSSLVVLGGALGLGVGLGLQTIVADFVSGLILLLEQPVRVGDRIAVGETTGDVIDIRGRSTWVRTNDNIVIIVPNYEFVTSKLTNWTANDQEIRISIPVGVSYGSDPIRVRDLLLDVARAHADVFKTPPPAVSLQGLGENALEFILRVSTTVQVHFTGSLRSELYFAILEVFSREGIELPFPQRDLRLRSVDPAAIERLRVLTETPPPAG